MLVVMSKYALPLLTITIIILLAILGYFIYQNQKLLRSLPTQSSPIPTATLSPAAIPTASPPSLTTTQLQENIKDSINSQNYAALTTFMTNPVQVFLRATECCGPQTPSEAESQMSYISAGTPFDFDQNNPTIASLKDKNSELTDHFIGISKNAQHVVAFKITGSKIEAIWMSVSWKLFNY